MICCQNLNQFSFSFNNIYYARQEGLTRVPKHLNFHTTLIMYSKIKESQSEAKEIQTNFVN